MRSLRPGRSRVAPPGSPSRRASTTRPRGVIWNTESALRQRWPVPSPSTSMSRRPLTSTARACSTLLATCRQETRFMQRDGYIWSRAAQTPPPHPHLNGISRVDAELEHLSWQTGYISKLTNTRCTSRSSRTTLLRLFGRPVRLPISRHVEETKARRAATRSRAAPQVIRAPTARQSSRRMSRWSRSNRRAQVAPRVLRDLAILPRVLV